MGDNENSVVYEAERLPAASKESHVGETDAEGHVSVQLQDYFYIVNKFRPNNHYKREMQRLRKNTGKISFIPVCPSNSSVPRPERKGTILEQRRQAPPFSGEPNVYVLGA